jgi:hypothetical protein
LARIYVEEQTGFHLVKKLLTFIKFGALPLWWLMPSGIWRSVVWYFVTSVPEVSTVPIFSAKE